MPAYPHIERYYDDLRRLVDFGGSGNEQSIRRAFAVCLDAYCRDHREKLALVDELDAGARNRPDGTVKDSLRMARGYWEAKDPADDLDAEIQAKFNRGYPRDNILFEDSQTAVLVQNGSEAMRVAIIIGLIHYLPAERLEYKYRHEIYANEVAILPYYIANLNIEYTYQERAGRYLEFPNLCFVDTLDNLDWQGAGASGGAVQRQAAFNLGGLSEENWTRVQEQNEQTISVIIGNPP